MTFAESPGKNNAQQEDNPLSLSVGVGLDFDSNLTVDAIDSNSSQGDEALVFDTTGWLAALIPVMICLTVGVVMIVRVR